MRNFAKLILFFSLSFIIIFAASTCIKFLDLRVDWAKSLPPKPETVLTLMISAAFWALSLTLFSSIIISLNYAVRKKYFAPMALSCIMLMSFLLCYGFSFFLEQWETVPPAQSSGLQMGDKGLLLTNELSKNETAVVLLRGMAEPLGPRIIAIPGQPLVYHQAASTNFDLPPVPFTDNTPWFLKSLSIDIRINAEIFQRKFAEGFFSYFIYVNSFIFLLCSLGYAAKFSVWPLANLFLASLALRGVLALNTFINTPEIQETISSLLNNFVPAALILPLLFVGFGILVNIYSLLAFASRRRYDNDV